MTTSNPTSKTVTDDALGQLIRDYDAAPGAHWKGRQVVDCLEELRQLRSVETTDKPADLKRDEKLRQVSLATVDAKLLGCGFLMILPDNSFQHIPLDRIQLKPESLPEEPK